MVVESDPFSEWKSSGQCSLPWVHGKCLLSPARMLSRRLMIYHTRSGRREERSLVSLTLRYFCPSNLGRWPTADRLLAWLVYCLAVVCARRSRLDSESCGYRGLLRISGVRI